MAEYDQITPDPEVMVANLGRILAPLESYRVTPSKITITKGAHVARGGFGSVTRGSLRQGFFSSVDVAVKQLEPAGNKTQRIRIAVSLGREINAWARLSHPNILRFVGFYLDTENFEKAWILSEWVNNGNITDYIRRSRPAFPTLLRLATESAAGLAFLHEQNPPICHGDIKGGNILVSIEGSAMLCDFGLARVVEDMPSGLTTSQFNSRGTIRYMSPELITTDTPKRDLKSDVWAFGCVIFEILTSKLPYHDITGDSTVLLRIAQLHAPAPDHHLDELPNEELRRVVASCWRNPPEARPTMREIYQGLVSVGR